MPQPLQDISLHDPVAQVRATKDRMPEPLKGQNAALNAEASGTSSEVQSLTVQDI